MNASEVMFEFSNETRVKILYILLEGAQRLSDISKHLEVTTAEVSRHLSRLLRAGIIKKRDNNYRAKT